jgi:micrococcal nuclease
MKKVFYCLIFLMLAGCMPKQPALIPVDTIVAMTMAAIPKTETPLPTNTIVPLATQADPLSHPAIDFSAPGAYCVPTDTERVRALVTRVLSGDTIEVAIGNDAFRVRYIGLDAPGIAPQMEWQGPQSVATNGDLVSGKYVILVKDLSDTDTEGALLRYVFVDNLFVNYELLRRGFAQTRILQPDTFCEKAFLAAQSEAQSADQGIWIATPTPTASITPTPTITSIPSATLFPVCNCTAPNLSCNSFKNQASAQACLVYCKAIGLGEASGLDKNNNGLACEGSN